MPDVEFYIEYPRVSGKQIAGATSTGSIYLDNEFLTDRSKQQLVEMLKTSDGSNNDELIIKHTIDAVKKDDYSLFDVFWKSAVTASDAMEAYEFKHKIAVLFNLMDVEDSLKVLNHVKFYKMKSEFQINLLMFFPCKLLRSLPEIFISRLLFIFLFTYPEAVATLNERRRENGEADTKDGSN